MILLISRVFALLFATIVISKGVVDYKNKNESLTMTVFWTATWLVITTIAFFPSIIDSAIELAGGSRTGLGTVLGIAIIFVLFVSYRVYVKANRIEKQVNQLAKTLALRDIKGRK